MPMKNPSHPGVIVRNMIDDLGLTITDAAKYLNVTRKTLSELVNKRSGVSAEMAVRLEIVFGSTAKHWLRLQNAFDLAQVKKSKLKVRKFELEDA